jgi:HSP20 family protein
MTVDVAESRVTKVQPEVTAEKAKTPVPGVVHPFQEMDRLFEDFFPRGWFRSIREEWPKFAELGHGAFERVPKADLVDRDEEVVIRVEMPGVEKKDLEVTMTETSVTVKGMTRREQKAEDGEIRRCEIHCGTFSRTVPLPAYVDSDKVQASFKDGILQIRMSKREKAERRSIPVE